MLPLGTSAFCWMLPKMSEGDSCPSFTSRSNRTCGSCASRSSIRRAAASLDSASAVCGTGRRAIFIDRLVRYTKRLPVPVAASHLLPAVPTGWDDAIFRAAQCPAASPRLSASSCCALAFSTPARPPSSFLRSLFAYLALASFTGGALVLVVVAFIVGLEVVEGDGFESSDNNMLLPISSSWGRKPAGADEEAAAAAAPPPSLDKSSS
mmetsp:Transcript_4956/g.14072  ORF Transcript_4956/g.14072 Transcript_4956/m.14072 type:complete len:208 (+) Transcript_4956:262-885(+)